MIKYFVILGSFDEGLIYPLMDGQRLQLYPTQMHATKVAEEHHLGHVYGYRVMALSDPDAIR